MSSLSNKVIGLSHLFINTQFALFRRYASDMESSIHDIEIEMMEKFEEMTKGFTTQEMDEFWEFHIDDHNEINKEYPNLLRSNSLTNAYSYFEKSLIENHTMVKLAVSTTLYPTATDLNSSSIKRKKVSTIEKILQCFLDISFPFPSGAVWDKILMYKDIRNNIMHNGGIVANPSDSSDRVVIAIGNLNHVSISPNSGRILFNEEFTNEVINTMIEFYEKLFQEIRNYKSTNSL